MPQTEDLPGVEGPGVAPVKIPEVIKAAAIYTQHRDERLRVQGEEMTAKKKLIEVLHKHQDKLPPPDKNGEIIYRTGDTIVILKPGKEDVKVKEAGSSEEE